MSHLPHVIAHIDAHSANKCPPTQQSEQQFEINDTGQSSQEDSSYHCGQRMLLLIMSLGIGGVSSRHVLAKLVQCLQLYLACAAKALHQVIACLQISNDLSAHSGSIRILCFANDLLSCCKCRTCCESLTTVSRRFGQSTEHGSQPKQLSTHFHRVCSHCLCSVTVSYVCNYSKAILNQHHAHCSSSQCFGAT